MALMGLGCLEPSRVDAGAEGGVDAAVRATPVQVPDAAYDPCVWDGRGDGYCFGDTAVVFDGTECRTVCGARPELGRSGVFASSAECHATCPCAREKFEGWGAPPPELDGWCDRVVAITEADAGVDWPLSDCEPGSLWASSGEQSCMVTAGHLDLASMSTLCTASALPQVTRVVCVVWPD